MFDYNPQMFSTPGSISMFHNDQTKVNPGHLYLRQPRTIEIIQLVEGPPPPPRRISSVIGSSSGGPSSSSYASSYDDSSCDSDEDEDAESYCSSYCSSDMAPEQMESTRCGQYNAPADDPYVFRMNRIHKWRELSNKALGPSRLDVTRTPPKRKSNENNDQSNDDNDSQSCKRPRPQAKLGMHSCSACDASFLTSQNLRQHGAAAQASEACRVAVEYDFE